MDTLVCSRCKLEKPVADFFKRKGITRGYTYKCKVCHVMCQREWKKRTGNQELNKKQREYIHRIGKSRSQSENRQCSLWLGAWIAERVLSHYFENLTRMPPSNPGYDFLCSKGYKIDVKSGCRVAYKNRRVDRWTFVIDHNKIANYFLCLAFDNRTNLNPEHIWLIPGEKINDKLALIIYDNEHGRSQWASYEKSIDKVEECCNSLKR